MAAGSSTVRTEQPILIEYFDFQDRYDWESEASAFERRPLLPQEVWIDRDSIVSPAENPGDGMLDSSGIVRQFVNRPLATVPGDPNRFNAPGILRNVVPSTYGGGTYQPTLTGAAGIVPFDPRVWIVDGGLGVVEFKYGIPATAVPPFAFSFWRYEGRFAGGAPAGSGLVGEPYIFRDVKAIGVNGGTFTLGAWRTRDLTTALGNPGGDVTLAANVMTVRPGRYWVTATAPGFDVGLHKVRLQNTSAGTTPLTGTSENSGAFPFLAIPNATQSRIDGVFTVSVTSTFELQHQCSVTKTATGFGEATGFDSEVYATITWAKIETNPPLP